MGGKKMTIPGILKACCFWTCWEDGHIRAGNVCFAAHPSRNSYHLPGSHLRAGSASVAARPLSFAWAKECWTAATARSPATCSPEQLHLERIVLLAVGNENVKWEKH